MRHIHVYMYAHLEYVPSVDGIAGSLPAVVGSAQLGQQGVQLVEEVAGGHTGPGGGSVGSYLVLVAPEHRVQPVLVGLLEETDVLDGISVVERSHA